MIQRLRPYWLRVEHGLPWFVFIILTFYTFGLFADVPYTGFDFNSSDGRVTEVFGPPQPDAPQVGDYLLQVGSMTWDSFRHSLSQPLITGYGTGEQVPVLVRRGAAVHTLNWRYPGFGMRELYERIDSEWYLAYFFWLAGTLTLLLLRPRDTRWRLLVAFSYVTALWIAGGSAVSRWHVWGGALKLHALTWLLMPLALHLHWYFPHKLGPLPAPLVYIGYALGGALALADVLGLLPSDLYLLGFLVAVVGSLVLLCVHFLRQATARRAIGLLALAVMLLLLPALGVVLTGLMGGLVDEAGRAVLVLPALPMAYFYAAARGHLGNLEPRANRLVVLYLFLALVGTVALILISIALGGTSVPVGATVPVLLIVLATTVVSILAFDPFQRWVERRLLGMPFAPEQLLASYGARIPTILDTDQLVQLLHEEILPSLLVREAVLLRLDDEGNATILGARGLDPADELLQEVLAQPGGAGGMRASHPDGWLRLMLPLKLGQEMIGLWLLGRRDPDDTYLPGEIEVLQAIANQSAISLVNISYTAQLHELYQTSIERQEQERRTLARNLHDVVLNQLAVLHGLGTVTPLFEAEYQELTGQVRAMIHTLRPPMLAFGLGGAVTELVDDLWERHPDGPLWECELAGEPATRFTEEVEEQIFRIVQQACENALRHSEARTVAVQGYLAEDGVTITVQDDGKGFARAEVLDLASLLRQGHFGLVGMLERAALIGGQMVIQSAVAEGTTITIRWSAEEPQ